MDDAFKNRKGFTFYRSYWEVISDLSDKQAGELMKGVAKYQFTGEPPKFKGVLNAVWKGFETLVDGQVSGYLNGTKTDNSNKKSKRPPIRGANRDTERPPNDKEQREKSKEQREKDNTKHHPSKEIFFSWVTESGRTEKFGDALWDYMNGRDWRTASDEPIKNWKTYCSSVIRSDDWDWGKIEDEAREQLYKDAMWLSQSRGRSYLVEETARSQLGMGRLNPEMEKKTKRYLENKKIVGLDDNSIHEFLRNRGR